MEAGRVTPVRGAKTLWPSSSTFDATLPIEGVPAGWWSVRSGTGWSHHHGQVTGLDVQETTGSPVSVMRPDPARDTLLVTTRTSGRSDLVSVWQRLPSLHHVEIHQEYWHDDQARLMTFDQVHARTLGWRGTTIPLVDVAYWIGEVSAPLARLSCAWGRNVRVPAAVAGRVLLEAGAATLPLDEVEASAALACNWEGGVHDLLEAGRLVTLSS